MIYRRLTALPASFADLEAEALRLGFHMLTRLRTEWEDGTARFDGPRDLMLGAFRDERLVGAGGIHPDPFQDDPAVGRLRHVYVLQAERRAGLATAIVQRLLDHARGRFALVRLRTRYAASLYERLGFERAEGDTVTHVFRPDRAKP